jgi:hypothetical protein
MAGWYEIVQSYSTIGFNISFKYLNRTTNHLEHDGMFIAYLKFSDQPRADLGNIKKPLCLSIQML